ncbi:hypothetical protein KS4_27000 [Poriferisphaera corsica]|uniref:Uncharacterized protein n=1 Tax=Poriferisphaera corsica TaxID=2528020 RepID=A0A517YWP6_9BACT|nr:hypothetical protein [Poriferisphaera corsica]QDU34629.1 hypothetical protein KS4_27000 [Poriferisphaera corsica]
MVKQKDVDALLAELEHARRVLKQSREAVYPQIDTLVERAADLHKESIGGKFEPALSSVHYLLDSMRRGIQAKEVLNQSMAA